MQVPEWGKQWYNGLRPENPGVQALAKLRMGHESPKKNTTFTNLYFHGIVTFFGACQGRFFGAVGTAKVYGTSSTINYHNYGSLAV